MKKRSALASHPSRTLVALAVLAALPGSVHANAARVDFAIGSVRGIAADGQERRLVRGSRLRSGDTVVTARGRAQLRFSDGSYTSLSPNTEFRIDEYAYAGEKDEGARSFFSLIKGGLRTITGAIGKIRRQAYKLTTPVATIGIRGTALWATYNPATGLGFGVGDGGIEVCSASCKDFGSGETGRVAGDGADPQSTGQSGDGGPGPDGDGDDSGYSRGNDRTPNGSSQVVVDAVANSGDGGNGGNGGGGGSGGGGDSGDGGTAPQRVPLPSGSFHVVSIVAASTSVVLESRGQVGDEVNGQFDPDGALISFDYLGGNDGGDLAGAAGNPITGIEDAGQDATGSVVGWGRWLGGEVGVPGAPNNYPELHYAVGLPTVPSEVPTGQVTATYGLIGATQPALVDGELGIVEELGVLDPASHLAADFGNDTVTANLTTHFSGGNTYNMNIDLNIGQDAGGAPRQRNIFGATSPGGVTGSLNCISGCTAAAEGFFAGPGASHAGITYKFNGGGAGFVIGAAGFEAR